MEYYTNGFTNHQSKKRKSITDDNDFVGKKKIKLIMFLF